MVQQLTLDHCLYTIDEKLLTTFKETASKIELPNDTTKHLTLNSLDTYAAILQTWCMLLEDDHCLYFHPQKAMPYSNDHYSLNLLKNSPQITQFKQAHQMNCETTYVLAFYLTSETLHWIQQLMKSLEDGKRLIDLNTNRNYYLVVGEDQVSGSNELYQHQKILTHLFATNAVTTDMFQSHISNALEHTCQYLKTLNSSKVK